MEKSKINKIQQTINLLEELSWLLEKNKKTVSFKDSSKFLTELINENSFNQNANYSRHGLIKFGDSSRQNKQILVGCLPELLQNTDLFGSTAELLDFAEAVLNLSISRSSKRSRNEYIGFIVCELTNSKDETTSSFVHAIQEIVGNEKKINMIKAAKKLPNFTWNETIKNIGEL